MFLRVCKYIVKEKHTPKYIIDDIEISSDSDRENSNEEILMKKTLMKKIKKTQKKTPK